MNFALLTYTEAAQLLGMSTGALRAAVARGSVPHLRLGDRTVRFDREEIVAWLRSCRVPARRLATMDAGIAMSASSRGDR